MLPDAVHEFEAGEIVWVDFGAPFGREQAGRRPAIVISSRHYNGRSSLIVVCPITRSTGHWPFKIELPAGGLIRGAVLVDQIRSIDRHARFVRATGQREPEILAGVHAMIVALLGIPVSN